MNMKVRLKFIVALGLLTIGVSPLLYAQTDTIHLTVQKAVDLAIQQNLMQKVSELELQKKQEKVGEYMAALYPTVKATGSYSRYLKLPVIFLPAGSPLGTTLKVGSDNSYTGAVSASVPVFVASIFESIRLGKKDVEISAEKVRENQINLAANIKTTYYNVLLLKRSSEVIGQSYQNALDNLKNIQNLNKNGMVSDYDVIRIKVQVENLYPNLLQTENSYDNLLNVLKILLNIDVNTPVSLDDGEVTNLEVAEGVLPTDGWQDANSTLRQLYLSSQMLDIQAKLVKSSNIPSLVAIGSYQYQAQANNFKFSDYKWVPTSLVGLQLNVPIFSGFSVRRQLSQVRISQQELALQTEFTQNNLNTQLQNEVNAINTAVKKVNSAVGNVDLAQRGYSIAKTSYNTGQATLLELNDAENAMMQARLNLIQAQIEYLTARADYEKTIGKELQ